MINIIIFSLIVLITSVIANKKNFLPNFSGEKHQKFFSEKKIPLIGGIFIIPVLFIIFFEKNNFFIYICCFIFLIGFLSDSKILSSPKKRFILQIFIVSLFVFYSNLQVTPTRIDIIDETLDNELIGKIFTIFCLMVLINGSNFIDGLNGLLLGYFLIIIFTLNHFNLISSEIIFAENQIFLIYTFIILIMFNFLNQFYLGDGGSYLVGFVLGFILISIYNFEVANSEVYEVNISPYYVILLLWYPCFENLFSLTRKILSKRSPTSPDNNHLHQLIFLSIKKKVQFKGNLLPNICSSLIINIFNFVIIFIASSNTSETELQLRLIIVAISVYSILYLFLKRNN